jgi:hypothetical protein
MALYDRVAAQLCLRRNALLPGDFDDTAFRVVTQAVIEAAEVGTFAAAE